MPNKTRDLEAVAIREILQSMKVEHILEWGCGTGKNTGFLHSISQVLTAIDFSEQMLAKARSKFKDTDIQFHQGDITKEWPIANQSMDIISSSLILEHVQDLHIVFQRASNALKSGGYYYVGELHPFKQYNGTKARFESEEGTQIVTCFDHHVSDFMYAADSNGFSCIRLDEWFDENDRNSTPRIISFLFNRL
jgi:ubiquinone/menaquinone biosynthesis C-methylase UbiE